MKILSNNPIFNSFINETEEGQRYEHTRQNDLECSSLKGELFS